MVEQAPASPTGGPRLQPGQRGRDIRDHLAAGKSRPAHDDDRQAETAGGEQLRLAEGAAFLPGIQVTAPETSVVMLDVEGTGRSPTQVVEGLAARGVGMVPFGRTRIRAVLHLEVEDEGVDQALEALAQVVGTTAD